MKKHIVLLLVLFSSLVAVAQLEVKLGSFKKVEGFVNINTDKMYDDNDKPYSVLKIKTENINDKQRRELLFQGDAATFFEVEYKVGEVWVYLSYYASYIKISHPDFSSTEFAFPFDMEPKCGYELTLINKTAPGGYGYLQISTTPENGATIKLNGITLEQKTPYTNEMISAGVHEVVVSKYGYKDVIKRIVVEEGQKENVVIEMPIAYGQLDLVSEPSAATVYIDNQNKGKTPLVVNNVRIGKHTIRLEKNGYHTEVFNVDVEEDKTDSIKVQLQYGKSITIETDKKGDRIYIDGKEKGLSPLSIIIPFGKHTVYAYRDKKSAVADIDVKIDDDFDNLKLVLKKETLSNYVQNGYKFITLNGAINQYGDMSYGMSLGSVREFGWFASVTTNFNFQGYKTDFECDENFLVNDLYPDYSGKIAYSRLSIMGGAMIKLSGPVSLRVGLGYGMRIKSYETNSGYWVKYSANSIQGIDLSLGLQSSLRGLVVSIDGVTTNFKIYEVKIGIGYGFKNK